MSRSAEKEPLPPTVREELSDLRGYWTLLAKPFRRDAKAWAATVRALIITAQALEGRVERLKARIAFLKNENAVLHEEIALLRRRGVSGYVTYWNKRAELDLRGPSGEYIMRAINEESNLRARYQRMMYGQPRKCGFQPRKLDVHPWLAGTYLRRPEPAAAPAPKKAAR